MLKNKIFQKLAFSENILTLLIKTCIITNKCLRLVLSLHTVDSLSCGLYSFLFYCPVLKGKKYFWHWIMSFDIWNFFKQRGCLTLRESKDIFFVLKHERMFEHSLSRIKIPSIHKPVVHYGVSIRRYWTPAYFRSRSSLYFCKFDMRTGIVNY